MTAPVTVDAFGARRAHAASGALKSFCDATVLDAADVHVAATLCRLGGSEEDAGDDPVALGIAFAVRAIRMSSVIVDLRTIASTATTDDELDIDLGALPWPDPESWVERLAASPLVAVGDDDDSTAPLRLLGSRLTLDRYWRLERHVADELLRRADSPPAAVDLLRLRAGLDAMFDEPGPDRQRLAAATAVLRSGAVVAGGPGTGKTTTVAKVIALLLQQPTPDGQPWRIALAAPTGKAAARLQEAVHGQAHELDVDDDVRAAMLAVEASTIHRLLGWRPDNQSRFRHDRHNQLPHHAVILDETSMVSLTLMSRVLEAVRPTARLLLVGDPQQLTSVEAGAVLGDVVGPADEALRMRPAARDEVAAVTGRPVDSAAHDDGSAIGDGIVVLDTNYRFGGGVGALAEHLRSGDADAAVEFLTNAPGDITWLPVDVAGPDAHLAAGEIQSRVLDRARVVVEAARRGEAGTALEAMDDVQVLCAHRRGPHGVSRWRAEIEHWMVDAVRGYNPMGWYAGRPLLVTSNDRQLDLYNGDTGVVIDDDGVLRCAFDRRGEIVHVAPARLSAVETLYAMTIHKSQGSQFGEVVVVLPDESSPILTRELLYTAVTRAQRHVTLVGTEASIRAAVDRPVSRASGLRERLWG